MANRSVAQPNIDIKSTERMLNTLLHQNMKDSPLAHVMYSYPWGEPNTPLANKKGPYNWQREELIKVGNFIKENKARVARGETPLVYKCAISSGRGPGKSTLAAWLSLWFFSCFPGSSTRIAANTAAQLTNQTFGEIDKWSSMAINGYCMESTQTMIRPQPWYADQLKKILKQGDQKYYVQGNLWSEDNPSGFAGEHSDVGMMVIFDEASGIPQCIWDVTDGFFTERTLYRFFFCFSNPRMNTGPFFECFHKNRNFWHTRYVDSRDVEGPDRIVLDEIIAKNGINSDVARVEVLGEFPSLGDNQFISRKVVEDAQVRQFEHYRDEHAALVIGCDPARFGNDSTVIRFRQGRDARSIPAIVLDGVDNMKVANLLAQLIDERKPDAVFIDSGAGAGIIDRLRERGYKIHEVGFGTEAKDPKWADHRTELWARMREWLGGGMIDEDKKLFNDLVGPSYEFKGSDERIKLESKEKMKKRSQASPDHADALALTFHLTIARHDNKLSRKNPYRQNRIAKNVDYKIFGGD